MNKETLKRVFTTIIALAAFFVIMGFAELIVLNHRFEKFYYDSNFDVSNSSKVFDETLKNYFRSTFTFQIVLMAIGIAFIIASVVLLCIKFKSEKVKFVVNFVILGLLVVGIVLSILSIAKIVTLEKQMINLYSISYFSSSHKIFLNEYYDSFLNQVLAVSLPLLILQGVLCAWVVIDRLGLFNKESKTSIESNEKTSELK